jgi:hypothetical protein
MLTRYAELGFGFQVCKRHCTYFCSCTKLAKWDLRKPFDIDALVGYVRSNCFRGKNRKIRKLEKARNENENTFYESAFIRELLANQLLASNSKNVNWGGFYESTLPLKFCDRINRPIFHLKIWNKNTETHFYLHILETLLEKKSKADS